MCYKIVPSYDVIGHDLWFPGGKNYQKMAKKRVFFGHFGKNGPHTEKVMKRPIFFISYLSRTLQLGALCKSLGL